MSQIFKSANEYPSNPSSMTELVALAEMVSSTVAITMGSWV